MINQLLKTLFDMLFGWSIFGAYDLTAIDASTHRKIQSKWTNNLSTKTPLMTKAKSTGGLHLEDGGRALRFPIVLNKGVAKSYYGDDVFDSGRQGGLVHFEYDWKQFYSQVRIDGIEEDMNSGPSSAADLLDGRFLQAETTTAENFEQMLMGDATGNVGGDGVARDWEGLQSLVANDPTTGTIGGVSRANNTNARNQAYTTAVTAFNTSQNGRNAFTTLWANCTNGMRSPNFGVTTVAIWVLYNLSLTTNERFELQNKDTTLGKAGFKSLQFMDFPITMSSQCPASRAYFLRFAKPKTDGGIFLVVHRNKNFKLGPFRTPVDGDWKVAYSLTTGQFCTDAPYLNGVATNITG